jgi:hypothetical protein
MTWGLVGAAAVTVVGGALMGGSNGAGSSGNSNPAAYDPYAQYRPAAAQQLNALMKDPSSAVNSGYGLAEQQAASRTMAAQGYTGSGNALVAAAQAGGNAYQQQFNNLAMLSGAGQAPASAMQASNQQANIQQGQTNQMWNQIGGLVGQGIKAYNTPTDNSMPPIDAPPPDNTIAPPSVGFQFG